uniref:NF-kappa-B inhibitor-interacting Ras-like protein 1 n=1 Tax=Plectus sambesii TaxID=2011161 RepID=A0A914WS55_9BILA
MVCKKKIPEPPTGSRKDSGPRRSSITQLLFGAASSPLTSSKQKRRESIASIGSHSPSHSLYASVARELEISAVRGRHPSSPSPSRNMGRCMRVVVAGPKNAGKTALLHQIAFLADITQQPYSPTIDDTYSVQMDAGERPKELIVFHDTAGISDQGPAELRRPYIQVADAFILVYSVGEAESFNRVDLLKKFLDRQFGKEKKEVPIIVLANKTDCPRREVQTDFAVGWAQRERVKFYEVTATDRKTLVDPVLFLAARFFHPPKESKFSLSKKLKPEKSGAAIVMDI